MTTPMNSARRSSNPKTLLASSRTELSACLGDSPASTKSASTVVLAILAAATNATEETDRGRLTQSCQRCWCLAGRDW